MDLQQMLERIRQAGAPDEPVTVEAVLDEVCGRSFGPLLLVAGLVTLAPLIGDIPGVPTLVGLMVALVALQLLIGRSAFWLPRWLLKRSIARDKLERGTGLLRRPAGWIDRLLRPRLSVLVEGPAQRVVALGCLAIALGMPLMEVIPFSANLAGLALTLFGLALVARDGLMALLGYALLAAIGAVLVHGL